MGAVFAIEKGGVVYLAAECNHSKAADIAVVDLIPVCCGLAGPLCLH